MIQGETSIHNCFQNCIQYKVLLYTHSSLAGVSDNNTIKLLLGMQQAHLCRNAVKTTSFQYIDASLLCFCIIDNLRFLQPLLHQ